MKLRRRSADLQSAVPQACSLLTIAFLVATLPACTWSRRPPDPMGTGAEADRYIRWVMALPVGPPMTVEDLRRQHRAATRNQ